MIVKSVYVGESSALCLPVHFASAFEFSPANQSHWVGPESEGVAPNLRPSRRLASDLHYSGCAFTRSGTRETCHSTRNPNYTHSRQPLRYQLQARNQPTNSCISGLLPLIVLLDLSLVWTWTLKNLQRLIRLASTSTPNSSTLLIMPEARHLRARPRPRLTNG